MKRSDYISWDEYFMGIAMLASKRSNNIHVEGFTDGTWLFGTIQNCNLFARNRNSL